MNTPKDSTLEQLTPMTGPAINNTEKARLRNILGAINVEDGVWSDCLAIALLSYFERHTDCPDDADKDDIGNNVWAVEKTNAALDRIAAECWPKDTTQNIRLRRERVRANDDKTSNNVSMTVNDCQHMSAQAEAEAE